MRDHCHRREHGHRKALYCIYCRTVVNHVETRNGEEAQRFAEDFAAGEYTEEAAESIAYGKGHK